MNRNLGDDLKNYLSNYENFSSSALFFIWRNGFNDFLKRNKFTDAVLISSDHVLFPVHKLLLASYSDYFRSLFIDNLSINNINYEDKVIKNDKFLDENSIIIDKGEQSLDSKSDKSSNCNHCLNSPTNENEDIKNESNQIIHLLNNTHLSTGPPNSADNRLDDHHCESSPEHCKSKKNVGKIKNFFRRIQTKKRMDTSSGGEIELNENLNNFFAKSNALIQNTKFHVFFPDIDSRTLNFVINFLYTGQLDKEISMLNLLHMIVAFDRLCLVEPLKILSQFLIKMIKIENCIVIYQFTKKLFLPEVENEVKRFILYNFSKIYRDEYDYLNLTFSELAEFLHSDLLNMKEDDLFEAIINWVSYEPGERPKYLCDLVELIRFNYVKLEMIEDQIRTNFYVKSNHELTGYLDKVISVLKTKRHELTKAKMLKYSFMKPRIPGDVLFCFGGVSINQSSSIFESYDFRTDRWYISAHYKIKKQLSYHSLISHLSSVYIIGGTDTVNYFNEMFKFDAITCKFEEKASMHQCRCYLSSVLLNDYIFAIGGNDGQQKLNTMERYDFNRNQWCYLQQMHYRRSDASAEVYLGKIYIVGGFDGMLTMNSGEFYSPDTNQWTVIAPLNVPRSGFRMVNYCSELYVIGGNSQNHRQSTVEKYCSKKKRWEFVESLTFARSNFASAVLEDKIFVIGGFDGKSTIDTVEVYDKLNKWRIQNPINMKRSGLSACVIKGLRNAADYTFMSCEFKNEFHLMSSMLTRRRI